MAYALRRLSALEIGLWYVMLNIATLADIVECGFSPTIGRAASYFWGGSREIPQLGLPTAPRTGTPNYAGLASLIRMAQPMYRIFGVTAGVLMLLAGSVWYWLRNPPPVLSGSEITAFLVLTVGSAVGMAGLFWMGLLFGLHRVRKYNLLLVAGLLLQYALSGLGLVLGWGVLALVLGRIVFILFPRWNARRHILHSLPAPVLHSQERLDWKILWPMTWRSGVATLASFLCLQSTTLVCSQLLDLATTASYGLSLQLGLMLESVAMSWLAVKYPFISTHRARRQTHTLIPLLRARLLLCVATFLLGAGVVMYAGPACLAWLRSNTSLLPPAPLAVLLAIVGLKLIVGLHAALMQTANDVPFLKAAVISGILTVPLAVWLGRVWGLGGILAAPLLAQATGYYWYTPWRCWRDLLKEARGDAAGDNYAQKNEQR